MHRCLASYLLVAAMFDITPTLAAQTAPQRLCFQGRPSDACRWFLITESRYLFRVTPGVTRDHWGDPGTTFMRHYLMAEAGVARNVSPSSAVGVTVWGGYDFGYEAFRLGLSARVRQWLGHDTSLEGSLGPAYTSGAVAQRFGDALGATAAVHMNLRDLFTIGLRGEWIPEGNRCPPRFVNPDGCSETVWDPGGMSGRSYDRTESVRVWRVYASAGVGSKPGLAGWMAAAALGLTAAAFGGGTGW